MKDYSDFPPCPYFLTVLKHSPEAAYIFVRLWQMNTDVDVDFITCHKKNIRNVFLTTPTIFRNKLMSLVDLGLISVTENPSTYIVELVTYDADFFEDTCS